MWPSTPATRGLAWAGLDVNTWLSDISGVGRGWGLLTSIQELDAHIVWQGQFPNTNDDPSYFSAPRTGLETMFRDFNNSYRECFDNGWTGLT